MVLSNLAYAITRFVSCVHSRPINDEITKSLKGGAPRKKYERWGSYDGRGIGKIKILQNMAHRIKSFVGIDKDSELLEAARQGKTDVIERIVKKKQGSSSNILQRYVTLTPTFIFAIHDAWCDWRKNLSRR